MNCPDCAATTLKERAKKTRLGSALFLRPHCRHILPSMLIGKQTMDREIDAILLLPDAIFLLDFKNWRGQHIEVEGSNGKIRRLIDGAWKE